MRCARLSRPCQRELTRGLLTGVGLLVAAGLTVPVGLTSGSGGAVALMLVGVGLTRVGVGVDVGLGLVVGGVVPVVVDVDGLDVAEDELVEGEGSTTGSPASRNAEFARFQCVASQLPAAGATLK